LALILRLHDIRLAYLAEFNLDRRPDIGRACMDRFANMALFGAFQYEFLFAHTSMREKLRRISAIVNHAEVRRVMEAECTAVVSLGILSRLERVLFRLRTPLLIYGFAEILALARRAKQRITSLYARSASRQTLSTTTNHVPGRTTDLAAL
jgi:hypothetical protein